MQLYNRSFGITLVNTIRIILFGITLFFLNSFTYDPFFCCLLLPIYNADTDKQKILKENKDKSGIYMWTNFIKMVNAILVLMRI
jgi:hypothetical protein